MPDNWDGLREEAETDDVLTQLKAERDRLARQLYEVKHKHADYLDTVDTAIREAIGRISFAEVPAPPSSGRMRGGASSEHAIALLSDMQTGKLTPDYNSDVARTRVMLYAEKIVQLTEIQRMHHSVDEITVCMLGDMIEGVDIFPGQQWLIDSTLYDQLFNTTPTILVDFLRVLLANFEHVTVLAVDGNHGRIGRKGQFGPMDNSDRMLYRIVQQLMYGQDRFELKMTDPQGERNWYMIGQWGQYTSLLIHGDQIRGHSGFPWYGLGKKVNGWGSGGIPESFGDVFMGHWHQLGCIPLNQKKVWANGSTESTNTFAAENLASQSEPSQWLLFCDPEGGRISASYAIDLRSE